MNSLKIKLKSFGLVVALESKIMVKFFLWINCFLKILTVIQVETWYWGFSDVISPFKVKS